jgi:hypothetical protein
MKTCLAFFFCNDHVLLALSTFELLNAGDDFLSQLKGANSLCKYFSDENIDKRKRQMIEKSSDGLFRYHNRGVIPRLALALIKALLIEYHDNVGHLNYRRLMASLLKQFLWDRMTFAGKSHCQRCVVCKRAKPDRRGGAALQSLGIRESPWKIAGIDYVTHVPKSRIDGYTTVFIMVCLLTKMAHFVQCHKEINAEE